MQISVVRGRGRGSWLWRSSTPSSPAAPLWKTEFEIDQKPRKALNPLPPKVLWALNLSCDHRLDCKYKQELSWASCVRTDKRLTQGLWQRDAANIPWFVSAGLPLLLLTVLYGGRLSCMFWGPGDEDLWRNLSVPAVENKEKAHREILTGSEQLMHIWCFCLCPHLINITITTIILITVQLALLQATSVHNDPCPAIISIANVHFNLLSELKCLFVNELTHQCGRNTHARLCAHAHTQWPPTHHPCVELLCLPRFVLRQG